MAPDHGDFHASGIILLDLVSKNNDKYIARALLDSGSGTNFVSEDILPHLKYQHLDTKQMKVTGINSTEVRSFQLVKIFISKTDCPLKEIKCYTLPGVMQYNVNRTDYSNFISHCKGLKNFSDPLVAETSHGEGLALILGPGTIRDLSYKSPSFFRSFLIDHTFFGPAVSGRLPVSQPFCSYRTDLELFRSSTDDKYFRSESEIDTKIKLLDNLEFLRDKEVLGVKADELHADDQICIDKFKKSVLYDKPNKRYIVALPFKNNKHQLPSNEWIALKRTQILQRQFMKDKNYGLQYAAQIQKLLVSDFIEEVLPGTPVGEIVHYLPHRGIIKRDSKTTSLRIVMDASCRQNASSLCLNDVIYSGPNLIISMTFLLLKFRLEKYGVCADIEKAFLNLLIRILDRDVLRFFFPSDIFDPSSPMKIYRYKVVMFGASCSPFLLAAVIETHLDNYVQDRILQESLKSIFIDNLLTSKKTEVELLDLYHNARKVYQEMGLNLRQWASNSDLLVRTAKADGVWDDSPKVKVLGLLWDPKLDEFSFKQDLKFKNIHSKRSVVATGNQIVDNFGFLLPIEMRYRVFVQKLWFEKFSWDNSFNKPKHQLLVQEWENIQSDIKLVSTATFKRTMETLENVELHIFSDASFGAFGCVAYFVIPSCKAYPKGLTQIRYSKGKVVSPQRCPKTDTIPKLELMGVVMSANAAVNLLKAYSNLKFSRKVLWSDSQTVLDQCASIVANKTNFVHNRVVDIRELCPGFELRYVATTENPADLITKPISAKKLLVSSLWWNGPNWLPHKNNWYKEKSWNLHPEEPQERFEDPEMDELEINNMYGNITSDIQKEVLNSLSVKFWKFGEYSRCIKLFCGLISFLEYMRTHKFIKCIPSKNDRAAGERLAILTMQKECFPNELLDLNKGERVRNEKYAQLKLYLDTYGIIRIQGRIRDEHFTKTNRPILFEYNHPFTILFIQDRHKCYNCSSVSYTLSQIRKEIHCLKLRKQIFEVVSKCIICRKLLSRPFRYPDNPPLNDYRTRCSRPFSMCGLDYIGPFFLKKEKENKDISISLSSENPDNPKDPQGPEDLEDLESPMDPQGPEDLKDSKNPKDRRKVWIVMFSCLVSRAVYLVLVPNRSTETFLRALRELSARHCEPRMFISDNEGAFEAANRVLQRISEKSEVNNYFGKRNIVWKFLPSRASWMGGVYERLVQIVKIELMKLQKKCLFSEMDWRSHLCELESIINDRPLTYVSDVGTEPEVITPNSIIHGCISESTLASDINIDDAIADLKQYRNDPESLYREKIKQKTQFWNKLQSDYIEALNLSHYKKSKSNGKYSSITPEVGTMVSIQDSNTKLGGRLGIIVKLLPSSDGVVRRAEVKTTIPFEIKDSNQNKSFKTEIRIKSIKHLLPLEMKVDMDHPLQDHIEGDDSQELVQNSESQNVSSQNSNAGDSPNLNSSIDLNEELTEKDEPCEASVCRKPGPPIDGELWIQCDICKNWYHLECVDLDPTLNYEHIPYSCPACIEIDFQGFPSQESKNIAEMRRIGKLSLLGAINPKVKRKAAQNCLRWMKTVG